jgi:hypothetical protein
MTTFKKKPKTTTWLTVQQAAYVLGVHPATVRKWAAMGDLIKRLVPGERAMQIKGNITDNGEHEVVVSPYLSWKLMTSRSF